MITTPQKTPNSQRPKSLPQLLAARVAGLVLAVGLLGCGSGADADDAVAAANEANRERIGNAAEIVEKQAADARFLVRATANARLEVELGKLAQAKANSAPVRAYGTRLISSRLALLDALQALATRKNLVLPAALGEDEQEAFHEASQKTGNQLDKQVMDLVVKTQRQDEDAFDDMADDAYDPDLRRLATAELPPLRELLAAAKQVQDQADDLP